MRILFFFIDAGKYLIKCKNNCVPEERIFLKNMGAKGSILEIHWLYKAITYMQTEEFSEYS